MGRWQRKLYMLVGWDAKRADLQTVKLGEKLAQHPAACVASTAMHIPRRGQSIQFIDEYDCWRGLPGPDPSTPTPQPCAAFQPTLVARFTEGGAFQDQPAEGRVTAQVTTSAQRRTGQSTNAFVQNARTPFVDAHLHKRITHTQTQACSMGKQIPAMLTLKRQERVETGE